MSVLKTILYFSIFKYPITKEEIFEFSDVKTRAEMDHEIRALLERRIIFRINEYFSDSNDPMLVERRLKGNEMARGVMPKAQKVGRLISRFPYVKSVSLSGALAKGYYDDDGDIDFFIITEANRLWIARTLLVLYKKIFLLNSKKYFCVNYFISTDHLKIAERNRFTATEMVTLIPVYGEEIFRHFMNQNQWTTDFFPNKDSINFAYVNDGRKSLFSKIFQSLLNTALGDFLDTFFRKVTLKRWNAKFSHFNTEDFNIAMKSTKNVSKHHPQNFQKKVITLLNEKYSKIKTLYNLELLQDHA